MLTNYAYFLSITIEIGSINKHYRQKFISKCFSHVFAVTISGYLIFQL